MVYLAIKWWIFPWQTGNVITRGYLTVFGCHVQVPEAVHPTWFTWQFTIPLTLNIIKYPPYGYSTKQGGDMLLYKGVSSAETVPNGIKPLKHGAER